MRGSNLGMSKAMALDTLGNAHMYLREQYSNTPWTGTTGQAMLDAAYTLGKAFNDLKADLSLIDFTLKG